MKLDNADQWQVKFATKETITYYSLHQDAMSTPDQVWFGSLPHQPDRCVAFYFQLQWN